MAALGDEMSATEMVEWSAFFALEDEERKAKKAEG